MKYVITVESLLQWIEWLDWQDGPRGDSYRAGITAGQALAQQMHFAPDFEFGPVDFDEYMEPVSVDVLDMWFSLTTPRVLPQIMDHKLI